MSDLNKEVDNVDDVFFNKLKQIDARTLELTIAKAVGELVGIEFDSCHIGAVNYDVDYPFQGAKFDISLSVSRKKWLEQRSASRNKHSSESS